MGLVFSYLGGSDLENRITILERKLDKTNNENRRKICRLVSMVDSLKRIDDKLKEFEWSDYEILTDPTAIRDLKIDNNYSKDIDEEYVESLPEEEETAYMDSKRKYTFSVTTVNGQRFHKEFTDKQEFTNFKKRFGQWAPEFSSALCMPTLEIL